MAEAAKQNIAVNDYRATALVFASPRVLYNMVETYFPQEKNSKLIEEYTIK